GPRPRPLAIFPDALIIDLDDPYRRIFAKRRARQQALFEIEDSEPKLLQRSRIPDAYRNRESYDRQRRYPPGRPQRAQDGGQDLWPGPGARDRRGCGLDENLQPVIGRDHLDLVTLAADLLETDRFGEDALDLGVVIGRLVVEHDEA